ncbi:MAG: 2-amino-4-hydroxy-6-hydroxymethyldihydropteridine diphosphokinase [Desulfovibrio sp.]|nr:2-amino-4-hydroxy-6-hydroxymethyldihydropteridine diphosphokinase [Desulfovibrio sp.]
MLAENTLRAYVCLGSNCAYALAMLERAREALGRLPDMRTGGVSPVYLTEPQEYAEQPWFCNQVLEMLPGPSWRPCMLVDALLGMEAELGRVRSPDAELRFGPRVIDADLLLFGRERSTHPHCTLPHPRLTRRAFALIPLLDVAPEVDIDGRPALLWLQRLSFRREGNRIYQ